MLCVYDEFHYAVLDRFKILNQSTKLLPHTKRLNLEDRILCTFNIYENEYFAQQNKYFHFQITAYLERM
jgi:hypothetical protein